MDSYHTNIEGVILPHFPNELSANPVPDTRGNESRQASRDVAPP